MPITDYCQKIKTVADSLRDVSYPVSDPALVLNTLRGLNPRFSSSATHISMTSPLPTFTNVRSMLLLQEMRMENESRIALATALFANFKLGAPASCGPGQCSTPPPSSPFCGNGSGKKGKNKRSKGSGGGAPPRQTFSATPTPAGPWVCFNPWPGMLPPNGRPQPGVSILGARPPAAAQAFTMSASSTMSTTPSPAPTWDQAALIAAMNNLSTQGHDGWIMDSGASSHMTPDDGSKDKERDSLLQ